MPMTLEERERLAYITNSPDHALLVEAMEGDDSIQCELEELRTAADEHDKELEKLEGELEEKDTEIATVEEKLGDTIVELRERVEELESVIEMAS